MSKSLRKPSWPSSRSTDGPRSIQDAQSQVCEAIKAAVVARFGEAVYDDVLAGHVLAHAAEWFTPYLSGPVSSRASLPLTPMGELAEVAAWMARWIARPALEVECGLGALGATLNVELSIDRDAHRVDLARAALPALVVECATIDQVAGQGEFGSVLSAFGLGRMDPGRGNPIFPDFVAQATRLLAPGGLVLVAEKARFQDNLVEPLVAHDYEILKMTSIKGTTSVMIAARKP
jgi:hypothetical protein